MNAEEYGVKRRKKPDHYKQAELKNKHFPKKDENFPAEGKTRTQWRMVCLPY